MSVDKSSTHMHFFRLNIILGRPASSQNTRIFATWRSLQKASITRKSQSPQDMQINAAWRFLLKNYAPKAGTTMITKNHLLSKTDDTGIMLNHLLRMYITTEDVHHYAYYLKDICLLSRITRVVPRIITVFN